ncbi:MAG: hypothetical protein M1820_003575 [Bogoriella megaspora]|nr:MAG: hypothetical protein M1820_003575 [Bogoriella megaspora]
MDLISKAEFAVAVTVKKVVDVGLTGIVIVASVVLVELAEIGVTVTVVKIGLGLRVEFEGEAGTRVEERLVIVDAPALADTLADGFPGRVAVVWPADTAAELEVETGNEVLRTMVDWAGQLVTSGPQLVTVTSTVVKTVDSGIEDDARPEEEVSAVDAAAEAEELADAMTVVNMVVTDTADEVVRSTVDEAGQLVTWGGQLVTVITSVVKIVDSCTGIRLVVRPAAVLDDTGTDVLAKLLGEAAIDEAIDDTEDTMEDATEEIEDELDAAAEEADETEDTADEADDAEEATDEADDETEETDDRIEERAEEA